MSLENLTKSQVDNSGTDVVTIASSISGAEYSTILYSRFVATLVKELGSGTLNILHAAVGISGEAGELLDAVKKTWVYNKPLDRANVIEELGDLEFYMAALRILIEASRQEVLDANCAKLAVRYAAGYSDAAAQARADKETTVGVLESMGLELTAFPVLTASPELPTSLRVADRPDAQSLGAAYAAHAAAINLKRWNDPI